MIHLKMIIIFIYCDGDNLRSFINKHINENLLIEENIINLTLIYFKKYNKTNMYRY